MDFGLSINLRIWDPYDQRKVLQQQLGLTIFIRITAVLATFERGESTIMCYRCDSEHIFLYRSVAHRPSER